MGSVDFGSDTKIALPGVDPSDRTARISNGRMDWVAPALANGEVIFRRQFGTFDNQATPGLLNSTMEEGWNYQSGGSQIDPSLGSIGQAYEASYNPKNDTIFSEWRIQTTMPGGKPQRPFEFVMQWSNGAVFAGVHGASVGIGYRGPNGQPTVDNISIGNGTVEFSNAAFVNPLPGVSYYRQRNTDGTAFVELPYLDHLPSIGDVIRCGYDPGAGVERPFRAGSYWLPSQSAANVPTPPDGRVMFWDAGTDSLALKGPTGEVTHPEMF